MSQDIIEAKETNLTVILLSVALVIIEILEKALNLLALVLFTVVWSFFVMSLFTNGF